MQFNEIIKPYQIARQLFAQQKYDESISLLNQILQRYPSEPKLLLLLATNLIAQNKLDAAEQYLEEALKLTTLDTGIYFQLGVLNVKKQNTTIARNHFYKAFVLEPNQRNHFNFIFASMNLAKSHQDFLLLKQYFDDYIKKYPDDTNAYLHRSNINAELGFIAQSLSDLDKYLIHNPNDIKAISYKAMQLLALGNYTDGWKLHEERDTKTPLGNMAKGIPLWEGQNISDAKLLIYPEQGFGDSIQFIRYALLAKSKGMNIVVGSYDQLATFMRYNLSRYGIQSSDSKTPIGHIDYQVSMMSLPYYFNTTIDNIPYPSAYLEAEPKYIEKWKNKIISKKLNIGIAWDGSKTNQRDNIRSIPLSQISALFSIDAEFHCLHKLVSDDDKQFAMQYTNLHFWDSELIDYSDTAGLISHLDLVISVDTSVAHLAGAMGKPVWILLPLLPDFRWLLDREDSVWYQSAKLFRQKERLQWTNVITQVADELNIFIQFHTQQ